MPQPGEGSGGRHLKCASTSTLPEGGSLSLAPSETVGRAPVVAPAAKKTAPSRVFGEHDPFAELRRDLFDEARDDAVTRLSVEHAATGVREVEALPRARDRDIHQAPLFLQAAVVAHRVLVREQALLQARDEHAVELEALGRMHGHQLHRVLAGLGLVVAGLQRRMG